MIAAVWITFGVLFGLWTMGMWVAAALAKWTASALAAGSQPQPLLIQEQLGAMPDWVTVVAPQLLQMLQDSVTWAGSALQAMLPWAGAAVSWLVPLIWIVWLVGTLVLVFVAVVAHFLIRRNRQGQRPPYVHHAMRRAS